MDTTVSKGDVEKEKRKNLCQPKEKEECATGTIVCGYCVKIQMKGPETVVEGRS